MTLFLRKACCSAASVNELGMRKEETAQMAKISETVAGRIPVTESSEKNVKKYSSD